MYVVVCSSDQIDRITHATSRTQVRDPLWLLEKNERSWVMIDSPLIEEEKEYDD